MINEQEFDSTITIVFDEDGVPKVNIGHLSAYEATGILESIVFYLKESSMPPKVTDLDGNVIMEAFTFLSGDEDDPE